MNSLIETLTDKIQELETELDAEIGKRLAKLNVGLEKGRAIFEGEVLRRHRELKRGVAAYIFDAHPLVILTAPVIYSVIVPLLLLDLFVSVYQLVCFPIYGIPKVKRRDYFVFDRGYLAYLNAIEKLNCAYCSYGNGLVAYTREIFARTEQYWCPIKHARRVIGVHARYLKFDDYGDAEDYQQRLEQSRKSLRAEK